MITGILIVTCDDCGTEHREGMSSGYEGWEDNEEAFRFHGWQHFTELRGKKQTATDIELCPVCFAKRAAAVRATACSQTGHHKPTTR